MRLLLFLSLLTLTLSMLYSPAHALLGVLIGVAIVCCLAAGAGIVEAVRTMMEKE